MGMFPTACFRTIEEGVDPMGQKEKIIAVIAVATILAILAMVSFSGYYSFINRMFLAGILASLACGVVGTFVVVRRVVFMSDAIAHSTFGGIGLAFLLQSALGWLWFDPMIGAALFALGAAVILSMGWSRMSVREDSVIGVLWVIGMALGVLFYSLVDPRNVSLISPESILFGSILLISEETLWMMLAILAAIYAVVFLLFRDLQILTFDEEHSLHHHRPDPARGRHIGHRHAHHPGGDSRDVHRRPEEHDAVGRDGVPGPDRGGILRGHRDRHPSWGDHRHPDGGSVHPNRPRPEAQIPASHKRAAPAPGR